MAAAARSTATHCRPSFTKSSTRSGSATPGPYNGSATYGVDNTYANDTWQYTVMSYMSENNYGGASYRFTMTPMIADILAVENLYGAPTTRAGDTVYGFHSTAGSMYDFSTYST